MPYYNRSLNCWMSVNPTDFVTSDEEFDDEYEIDYPSDSEEEDDEEEKTDLLNNEELLILGGKEPICSLFNEKYKQLIVRSNSETSVIQFIHHQKKSSYVY